MILTQTVSIYLLHESKVSRFRQFTDKVEFGMTSAVRLAELMAVRTKQKGFTLIELLLVCSIIGIISAMAIPHLMMAKNAADAASAIGSLRTINSSQSAFAGSCAGGFYAPDLTTLGTTPPGSNAAYISPDLATANVVSKSGYTIQMGGTAAATAPLTCNGLGAGLGLVSYKAAGDPFTASSYRFFATNSSQTIYEDTVSLWAAMPELGAPATGQPIH